MSILLRREHEQGVWATVTAYVKRHDVVLASARDFKPIVLLGNRYARTSRWLSAFDSPYQPVEKLTSQP